MKKTDFDVIVVGGGHAGCEAALACAKLQCRTLLITMTIDNIAAMSCNPAIGGLAKGHLVKEIDALGGMMGIVADETAIQFRILNRKKGAAVQGTRCQSDMIAYKNAMRCRLEAQKGLYIIQAETQQLLWENNTVKGVVTQLGDKISASAVILTTGTFLNGLIHIGHQTYPAGRAWEFPASTLSKDLQGKGIRMGRLKTGTTPRLDKRTINFTDLEPQPGDEIIRKFSFWRSEVKLPQVPCHIAHTNEKTHDVIRENLKKSALYGGAITGIGPRYCPSIEDKIVKFPDKERHQTFLEPTGLQSIEIYPNGMSTSLPPDVQLAFLRSMKGLESVEVIRAGYAIEYDYVYPTQLKNTLEMKDYSGLYCAGQINGTSGYEEAAAQGLMAGINAALSVKEQEPFFLLRNESYIGVLIDDLVTKGTEEPYRMFTSRAEYRLLLREDNADLRLSEKGYRLGLLPEENYRIFEKKQENITQLWTYLKETKIAPGEQVDPMLAKLGVSPQTGSINLTSFLKKPHATLDILEKEELSSMFPQLSDWDEAVKKYVETEIKYEGYIKRQESQLKNYLKIEAINIPDTINYDQIGGLSREVLQKLKENRPQTLGQAGRISGITPAAIVSLMVHIENRRKQ